MNAPARPPSQKPPTQKAGPPEFVAGLIAGVMLWGVLAAMTHNFVLGMVFGLGSGVLIGVGLHLTQRRK
jgi:hypothetical protein